MFFARLKTMRTRVVVAVAQPTLAATIEAASSSAALEVVATVSSGNKALQAITELSPDVLLLDIDISSPTALDVLHRMSVAAVQTTPVIVIRSEGEHVIDALLAGARGAIKMCALDSLLSECIRDTRAGKLWLEQDQLLRALDTMLMRATDEPINRRTDADGETQATQQERMQERIRRGRS